MILLYNCLFECLRRHARPQNSHTLQNPYTGFCILLNNQISLVDLACMLKFLRAFILSIHLKNPNYSKVS